MLKQWFSSYYRISIVLLIGMMIATGCVNEQLDEYDMDTPMEQVAGNDCYSNEELVLDTDTCTLRVECDDAEACSVWGDQITNELDVRYASFVDMIPLELSEEEEEMSEDDEDILAEYEIEGNHLIANVDSADVSDHEQLWNDFTWLFPYEEREMVTAFSVFSHVDTVAHVVQNEDNLHEWSLGINIDPAIMTSEERVSTLIHEFGHLLTLNSTQLDPFEKKGRCRTLFLEEGCASEDAYIYPFYSKFWSEQEYDYNEDQFVSEYAATDFVEDIAESWMYFVLTEKPDGLTIAEKKVLFFYEYEELVMLRATLLARVMSWMERYGE